MVRKYSVYFDKLNINSDRWNCFRGSKEIRNKGILEFFTGVNNEKQAEGAKLHIECVACCKINNKI